MKFDPEALRIRYTKMADDELLRVVQAPAGDFRSEAVCLAEAELYARGIPLEQVPGPVPPKGAPLSEPGPFRKRLEFLSDGIDLLGWIVFTAILLYVILSEILTAVAERL